MNSFSISIGYHITASYILEFQMVQCSGTSNKELQNRTNLMYTISKREQSLYNWVCPFFGDSIGTVLNLHVLYISLHH